MAADPRDKAIMAVALARASQNSDHQDLSKQEQKYAAYSLLDHRSTLGRIAIKRAKFNRSGRASGKAPGPAINDLLQPGDSRRLGSGGGI